MTPLLAGLNEKQAAAVTLPNEHALILAGAGSGKTRVLTTRIAWLLATGKASPSGILAVTFTNKAAKEMQTRLSAMTATFPRYLWVGTFHGLCNRLLRLHYKEANLPQGFPILDSADQLALIRRLLKNLNVDEEVISAKELAIFINAHKEEGVRAKDAEAFDAYTQTRVSLYLEYEAQCQREGVCDFAELLLRSYELLVRHEPLRLHYQNRFTHLLVDEFQDTNALQYRWLKLLTGHGDAAQKKAVLFAVGDDDQSIYAFRGAKVANMQAFLSDFGVSDVIRLEQNYRSSGNILDAANALISENKNRLGKNLWTDADQGESLRLFAAPSDIEEAVFVSEEMKALAREGMDYEEMAILYRSNAQSRVLEHQLFVSGIPYRVMGGLRFFDRQEIKHALAYLRLLANPDDDTAFSRIVNVPARKIGARTLEALSEEAHLTNSSLYNAGASLAGKAGASVRAFITLMEDMRRESVHFSLTDLIAHLIDKSGLRAHYLAEKEGSERLENLDELVNASIRFLEEADDLEESLDAKIAAFLAHAALESGENQAKTHENAITMMTVHAAKGLEFEAVFITGLEEGLFPHDNAKNTEAEQEEERRLMYVALTRAKKRLYLSYAETRLLHGQMRFSLPSQFLDAIPEALFIKMGKTHSQKSFWHAPQPQSQARSSSQAAYASAQTYGGFSIGQSVLHPKFGKGVLINAEAAQVCVNFEAAGEKWLALAYAKLQPA